MPFGKLKRYAKHKLLVLICATLVGYWGLSKLDVSSFVANITAKFGPCRGTAGCAPDMMLIIRPRNPPTADPHAPDLPPPSAPPPCTFAYRRQRVQRICKTSPPPRVNTLFANFTSESELVLSAAIYDLRRKTLGCLVNKVASTSWYKYLANHSENSNPEIKDVKRYRLKNYGLDNRMRVPLGTIRERIDQTWRTYMFVRHPLQRLVSAYSHTVKKQKLHDNITFDEYMEKLASGVFTDYDIHWSRYTSFCHPCDIDYDYIIKMETLDTDMPILNGLMGIDENATFSQQNKNKYFGAGTQAKSKESYGYDSILADFQRRKPKVFEEVLKLYRKDMDMYGYDWDAGKNSTCGHRQEKHSCC